MAEEAICPKCGTQLPANAPKGLCPQCLMKAGMQISSEDAKGDDSDIRGICSSATSPGGFLPPEPEELAEEFPQLEIVALLGIGGMGAVYKARQKQLDRLVALKILPPKVRQSEAFAERFTREARSMAKLHHPQIVTVFEFGQTAGGIYYFIMEFVDGTDLRQMIQAGKLTVDQALTVIPQICEALQYAHRKGVVHRDIKPENILLDQDGCVRIADFGLARLLDKPITAYTLTQADHRMGTPQYMAPEQIEHPHEVDHRADIYSLGVVFYEMLTGELPIGRFAPPSKKVEVDVRLDEIVLRTLENEPGLRYQQASEVKTDVETITKGPREVQVTKREERVVARQEIPTRIKAPAIGLLTAGIIDCLSFFAIPALFHKTSEVSISLPSSTVKLNLGALVGIILIIGAVSMLGLRSYRLSRVISILGMIPIAPGFVISLPFGIWALCVLGKPEVRAAFPQKQRPDKRAASTDANENRLE